MKDMREMRTNLVDLLLKTPIPDLCNVIAKTDACRSISCSDCPVNSEDALKAALDSIKEMEPLSYPALFRSASNPGDVIAFTGLNSGIRVSGPQCGVGIGAIEDDWAPHTDESKWTPVDVSPPVDGK